VGAAAVRVVEAACRLGPYSVAVAAHQGSLVVEFAHRTPRDLPPQQVPVFGHRLSIDYKASESSPSIVSCRVGNMGHGAAVMETSWASRCSQRS
jgi:hypothetical protein